MKHRLLALSLHDARGTAPQGQQNSSDKAATHCTCFRTQQPLKHIHVCVSQGLGQGRHSGTASALMACSSVCAHRYPNPPVIGPVLLVKHKGVHVVVLNVPRLVVAGGNALLGQRVSGAYREETLFEICSKYTSVR